MIWLVRVALSHPYTFVFMAILIAILGIVTIFGMSTDILPEIDIASNVPIVQIAASSPTLTEAQLYDYGLNFIRTQLATVQGAVQILRERFVSSVLLVKALGGGWTSGGSSQ